MKVDSRTKYAGVRFHLDENECSVLLEWYRKLKAGSSPMFPVALVKDAGRRLNKLVEKDPDVLKQKTIEQVKEALAASGEKVGKQLAAIKAGKEWQKVK